MKFQCIFAVCVLLLPCVDAAPSSKLPVCVIGAGPSGLIVANKLEAKGHSVVIFEKDDKIGGKCQAYYEPNGQYHPLGGLLMSNGTYVETLKVVSSTGVPATLFDSGQRWAYDYTTGASQPFPQATADFVALVTAEYIRYTVYWNTIWAPYNAIRYKNGVPPELSVTCAEWLAANNFQALPVLFVQSMVAFGYGDIRETPITYMLTYLTPDILGYFADFHEVFVRFSKTIKGPIYLSTTITDIDRSSSQPVVSYHTSNFKNKAIKQQCSALVVAFPPTPQSLKAAKLKVSANETAVFSPVALTPYYASATNLSNVPFGFSFSAASSSPALPPVNVGEPVYWLQLFPNSTVITSWSWGNNQTTASQAYALLKSTLSLLNRDPTVPGSVSKPVTDADVKAFVAPPYFPHYSSEAIKGGIYEKYNALQGQQSTYYTSALAGFEIVEFVLRAGIDLVESYF